MEIWKPIKNYESYYEISNIGRVRRIKYDNDGNKSQYKIPYYIKCRYDRYGYKKATLCLKQKNKEYSVHRLVAQAFIPNPLNKPTVNHIDGIKDNNKIENLEWNTIKEQNNHALQNKLRIPKKGKDIKTSKIVEQYDSQNNLLATYESSGEAGRKNDISSGHIRDCCRGHLKTYKGFIWKYKQVK